ncbi:MAG: ComF family protein [Anaerolineales bacterium]|nr:ComF family protein [Anaerolineales bacterium]MDW8226662.1 ComF family protein [Anaerolineales bacterium]
MALHSLKYRRNLALGEAIARQMLPFVRSLGWKIDCAVPVPLGKARLKERGYNQVALVALPIAVWMGWRYVPQALVRSRETRSQVGLSAAERRLNVQDAFEARQELVAAKTVLVMDDVVTTGSTLASCASALLKAGARSVYVLTIARALSQHGLDHAL